MPLLFGHVEGSIVIMAFDILEGFERNDIFRHDPCSGLLLQSDKGRFGAPLEKKLHIQHGQPMCLCRKKIRIQV